MLQVFISLLGVHYVRTARRVLTGAWWEGVRKNSLCRVKHAVGATGVEEGLGLGAGVVALTTGLTLSAHTGADAWQASKARGHRVAARPTCRHNKHSFCFRLSTREAFGYCLFPYAAPIVSLLCLMKLDTFSQSLHLKLLWRPICLNSTTANKLSISSSFFCR